MNEKILRIKLGDDRPAPQPDPMGRSRIGYQEDLSTEELWDRGRGCWVLKPERALEADLLVLAHAGRVVLVGTVNGLAKVGSGRFEVLGEPVPDHFLIGRDDPWDNQSMNPVTYGDARGPAPATRVRRRPESLRD